MAATLGFDSWLLSLLWASPASLQSNSYTINEKLHKVFPVEGNEALNCRTLMSWILVVPDQVLMLLAIDCD
jgi:hypothetical protein